jgi:hypothetical protein
MSQNLALVRQPAGINHMCMIIIGQITPATSRLVVVLTVILDHNE